MAAAATGQRRSFHRRRRLVSRNAGPWKHHPHQSTSTSLPACLRPLAFHFLTGGHCLRPPDNNISLIPRIRYSRKLEVAAAPHRPETGADVYMRTRRPPCRTAYIILQTLVSEMNYRHYMLKKNSANSYRLPVSGTADRVFVANALNQVKFLKHPSGGIS